MIRSVEKEREKSDKHCIFTWK